MFASAAVLADPSLKGKPVAVGGPPPRGIIAAASKSIQFITSEAFRNKAYGTVSKILANGKKLDDALSAAQAITNPYKKAEALQYVLDVQKPREISHLKNEKTGTEP